MTTILTGGRLFTGERLMDEYALVIDHGTITAVLEDGALADAMVHRLPPDALLVPGFVDIQVNGGGGVLFNDDPTTHGALAIARAHRRLGTTAVLPTVITDRPEVLLAAAGAAAEAALVGDGGVVGVHIEGPFLNPERKGAHPAAHVRLPDPALLAALAALPARFGDRGRVLLTLAPEQVPDGDIARLVEAGLLLFGGHSAASIERTEAAIRAGLSGFTHLFNAMPPIGNRTPGIALAALSHPDCICGVIADGIHVHPELLRLALRLKPPGSLVLVSDAMPPAGTDLDRFVLLGRPIRRTGGRLVLEDGTLAGADLDLAQAVRNAISLLGVPLEEALRMASLYPARALGLHTRGRLAPGCRADLVQLDADLAVRTVWVGGTVEG